MFITSENYKSVLTSLISEEPRVDVAVAFWGQGADELFLDSAKRFRVICNLTSGGTNPTVIEQLQLLPNVEIRHLDDLHAKVIAGRSQVIVGSANLSTNGLNAEDDEADSWQEAGYLSRQEDDIKCARQWFSKQWKRACEITPAHMAAARKLWTRRRRSRPLALDSDSSLLTLPRSAVAGRNIVVAIYQGHASEEGNACFKVRKSQEVDQKFTRSWDFYEDWKPSAMKKDQLVIDVYFGKLGAVRVSGPNRIFEISRIKRKKGPNRGETMVLHYAQKVPELLDLPAKQALAGIEELVRQCGRVVLGKDQDGQVLPLEDFLDLIQQK